MTRTDDTPTPVERSSWLTSQTVVRLQRVFTRLRFLLALPAAAVVVAFTDRGPMWPGVALALFGEVIQIWASAHLRKNVEVIMSGPYAWVRNPMYLGRFFVGLGLTALTWRWWLVLPYVVIFWLYAQARVLGEERRLRERFGEEYQAYCRAVRRWLPTPPKQRFSDARWSWACVFRNHELRVSAVVVLCLLLLRWRIIRWGPLDLR